MKKAAAHKIVIQSKARFVSFLLILTVVTALVTGITVHNITKANMDMPLTESMGIHTQWC